MYGTEKLLFKCLVTRKHTTNKLDYYRIRIIIDLHKNPGEYRVDTLYVYLLLTFKYAEKRLFGILSLNKMYFCFEKVYFLRNA